MPWDFTWDRWSPGTYIWKNGNIVVLSSLIAANPGNGSLRLLWDGLTEAGYEIQVPTPFPVVWNGEGGGRRFSTTRKLTKLLSFG